MKKRHKKNIRFKASAETAVEITLAQKYMHIQRKIMPLIKGKQLGVGESIMLISCMVHADLSGNYDKHQMTEDEVLMSIGAFLGLWKKGLFIPGPDFFTLEQAREAFEDEGEEE
jgi:hypothetical protein